IVRPGISQACSSLHAILHSGKIKISRNEIELYGTKILFNGNPVPDVKVSGSAVILTWSDGATVDVSVFSKRLDPRLLRVEIYENRAVIVTSYGSVEITS